MPARRDAIFGGAAAVLSLAIAAAVLWTLTAGGHSLTSESWRRASVAAEPRSLPVVLLEGEAGNRFTLDSLCGRVMVVDFIYTRCQTICKGLGGTSSQLARRFRDEGLEIIVMSLSFDPAYDTPDQLRAFKRAMEPATSPWQLARPVDDDARDRLMSTFGVVAIPDGLGGFDHNAALHVVDRHCRLVQVLDAEDIGGALAVARRLAAAGSI